MSHGSWPRAQGRAFPQVHTEQVHPIERPAALPDHYNSLRSMEVTALPQRDSNIQATCALLRTLLTDELTYRRRWRARSDRTSGMLNQAAVAKVMERHLWDTGEYDDMSSIARMLKDRVSRALAGKVLSSETLTWIIDAFDMAESDRDRLWALFSGKERLASEIAHTLRRRREMIRRQGHRTVALVERYTVDRSRLLGFAAHDTHDSRY
jgi:hypothetical protein